MIKAIIPIRESASRNIELEDFFKEAGVEILYSKNKQSIWEAFSAGYKYIGKTDIVILCHDDIYFYTSPKKVIKIIKRELSDLKTGFIGVAGAKKLRKSGVWWDGIREPVEKRGLSGQVFHAPEEKYNLSYYGPYGQVQVLDGVFIACRASLLQEIGLNKPSWMPEESNWDFYDVFMTFKADQKGYVNKTVPIQITHDSKGIPRDSWDKAREAFITRFMLG